MKRVTGLLLMLLAALPSVGQPLPDSLARRLTEVPFRSDGSVFRFSSGDPGADRVRAVVDSALGAVEAFFGSAFPEPFDVTLVPDRQAFTAVLREAWGVPETACWMVGAGVADFLVLLSPAAWTRDACEHDGSDPQHLGDLVTHELVHVFHGQHNPTRDFSGVEEIGWFVEGLAVLASGQLLRGHLASPVEAVESGQAPNRLAEAWSGKYRYGVSGSLVSYLDHRFGRALLLDLLAATSQKEILARLSLREEELLEGWEVWVTGR